MTAATKFLGQSSTAGALAEYTGVQSSAGSGDVGKIVALNSAGQIDNSMLPTGVGAETKSIVASEALSAGNFVNVWNNSGTINVRKADASSASAGKPADGFVLASVSMSASATVYFAGINNQLTSLTAGDAYFGDDSTAGGATLTAPTTSGHMVQYIGDAVSTTEIAFHRGTPIVLA